MYMHIHLGSRQEQYKISVLFISVDLLATIGQHVHVARVDGREKTSPTGRPGGRVRCTTQKQKRPTKVTKKVIPFLKP